MDAEAKFDQSDIERQLQESKSYYSKRDKEIRTDLELYDLDFSLDLPDGFHEIKAPTTKVLCDRAADRIGSGRIQAHMEPRHGGDEERKRIERKEKAGAALPYLMRRRIKYNPIRGMALHAFNRGGIVAKFQIDQGFAEDKPKRSEFGTEVAFKAANKLYAYRSVAAFPLTLDVRPIENVYMDSETDGENWVIEHYERTIGDIRKNFPNWDGWKSILQKKYDISKLSSVKTNIQNSPDAQRCRYTEVWSRFWRAVMVDGQFVSIGKAAPGLVPNLFNRPPYFIRYSGFGDPSGTPDKRCMSILRAIRYTSRSMSRLYSILDTVAENEAYGATLLKAGDSGNANFEIGPGAKNEMDFPDMVRPYSPKGVDQNLLAALSAITASNEYGSVASEAIGQPPQGGRGPFPQSGVGAAIASGQAAMLLDPVNSAIEDVMSDVISFAFYVLDDVYPVELPIFGQVGEESYVQFTLRREDIDGHYGPVAVKNLMRSPEDDYAKYQLGIQAMTAGLPPEFVMEKFFGQENAHEMVKDMMAKQIAYSPKVRDEYLIPRLIERLKAKSEGRPETLPGEMVPPPSGALVPQPDPMMAMMGAGGGMPAAPNMGTAPVPNAPNDAMAAAQMGVAPVGPAVPNGPAVSTAGV